MIECSSAKGHGTPDNFFVNIPNITVPAGSTLSIDQAVLNVKTGDSQIIELGQDDVSQDQAYASNFARMQLQFYISQTASNSCVMPAVVTDSYTLDKPLVKYRNMRSIYAYGDIDADFTKRDFNMIADTEYQGKDYALQFNEEVLADPDVNNINNNLSNLAPHTFLSPCNLHSVLYKNWPRAGKFVLVDPSYKGWTNAAPCQAITREVDIHLPQKEGTVDQICESVTRTFHASKVHRETVTLGEHPLPSVDATLVQVFPANFTVKQHDSSAHSVYSCMCVKNILRWESGDGLLKLCNPDIDGLMGLDFSLMYARPLGYMHGGHYNNSDAPAPPVPPPSPPAPGPALPGFYFLFDDKEGGCIISQINCTPSGGSGGVVTNKHILAEGAEFNLEISIGHYVLIILVVDAPRGQTFEADPIELNPMDNITINEQIAVGNTRVQVVFQYDITAETPKHIDIAVAHKKRETPQLSSPYPFNRIGTVSG